MNMAKPVNILAALAATILGVPVAACGLFYVLLKFGDDPTPQEHSGHTERMACDGERPTQRWNSLTGTSEAVSSGEVDQRVKCWKYMPAPKS
jgi:hypothetical protein